MTFSTKPTYVARTPGLKCQRCGKDISYRVASTKWCTDCSRTMSLENNTVRRALFVKLLKRDAAIPPYKIADTICHCQVCDAVNYDSVNFCYYCGQRLKEGDFSGQHQAMRSVRLT